MIKVLHNFDKIHSFILACSGGVDSIAAAGFMLKGGKKFELAYFNHGTPQANEMQDCVERFASSNNLKLHVAKIDREKLKDESPEEYYRNCRYKFLHSLNSDIVTGQHLDDVAEGWVFSCLNGNPKLMQVKTKMDNGYFLYRPFLGVRKDALRTFCLKNNFSWVEDASNMDCAYKRNFIRNKLMEDLLKVNPGLHKTLLKKLI